MTPRWPAAMTLLASFVFVRPSFASEPDENSPTARATTALVWIFGDDDTFNPPNSSTPPSPAASIGDRSGYDPLVSGYRSRYTGRENRLELRLRGEASDLVPSLTTTAELAVGLDLLGLGEASGDPRGEPVRAEDLGSFAELRASLAREERRPVEGAGQVPAVALRLYPIDGDLERVGWLEALGWGGAVGPRRESLYATAAGPVRAALLALELTSFVVHVGLKTATFVEPVPNAPSVAETSYGAFSRLEVRPGTLVRIGLAGGYFEHGKLQGTAQGARAVTGGASAAISVQRDMEEPRSPITFLGPGDDPFRATKTAPPGAFAAGLEAAGLVQRLADFDRPGQTQLVPARAFAAFGAVRLGRFETSAAVLLRDPEFVMRNAPGVFGGRGLPAAAQREGERALLLSNGLFLSELVRADVATGLRFPAAVMTAALDRLGQSTGATFVLNGPGDVALLPLGAAPVPIFDVRGAVEARLSSLVSVVGWMAYRRDYNRRATDGNDGNASVRGFSEPDRFGYGVAARAVW
jgi:hypothetical protein